MARAIRIIEYDGPADWVQHCVASGVRGPIICGPGKTITGAILLFTSPEIEALLRSTIASQAKEERLASENAA